jgi:hypothetical protein
MTETSNAAPLFIKRYSSSIYLSRSLVQERDHQTSQLNDSLTYYDCLLFLNFQVTARMMGFSNTSTLFSSWRFWPATVAWLVARAIWAEQLSGFNAPWPSPRMDHPGLNGQRSVSLPLRCSARECAFSRTSLDYATIPSSERLLLQRFAELAKIARANSGWCVSACKLPSEQWDGHIYLGLGTATTFQNGVWWPETKNDSGSKQVFTTFSLIIVLLRVESPRDDQGWIPQPHMKQHNSRHLRSKMGF